LSNKSTLPRVLIISRDIEIGGMQKAAITLAQNLVNAGFLVDYFCLFKRRDPEEFSEIDPRIQLFQPKYFRESTPKWFYIVYNYLRLRRISKKYKYDKLLSFGEHFNGFNILALWKNRSRLFVLDRMNPEMNCGFPNENLRRYLYKYTKGLIVQTDFARNVLFVKTQHPNIRVIRNFLSVSTGTIKELQNARKENTLTHQAFPISNQLIPQILYVGRLSPEKGVNTLIDSALKLIQEGVAMHLNVVGEGALMAELKAKVNQKGLETNDDSKHQFNRSIQFHGAISEPIEFYKSNHIFILPSLSEGFPNALIEAMSAGMACIVSDRLKNKLAFLIDRENVLFFECENYLDLSDKINQLLTNSVLWSTLSNNSMELAKWFKSESILNEYLDFLNLSKS
jgi:GalNAc-alpha-(1->4)-GalNAc-alpha-(1->3)-diNAcBac-PP-undecaprenol alpha-1,4-N-acetyl-D-galactosaminyltransferase